MHELTQTEKDELEASGKADREHYEKVTKEQDALWDRIFGIMTPEEKADVPHEIISLNNGGWSPATRDMAIKFIRNFIGENHKTRVYLTEKWKKFWKENPEIHF